MEGDGKAPYNAAVTPGVPATTRGVIADGCSLLVGANDCGQMARGGRATLTLTASGVVDAVDRDGDVDLVAAVVVHVHVAVADEVHDHVADVHS
jgi:hypothetical protein